VTDVPDELKHEIQEALDDATPEAIEWHMVRQPGVPWGKARGETRYVVWTDSSLTGDCERCLWDGHPEPIREFVEVPDKCTCGQLGEPAVDEVWGGALKDLAAGEHPYWPKGARIADFKVSTQGESCWLQDRWLCKWHKPGEWPASEEYTEDEVRKANLVELEFAKKWAADRIQRNAWISNTMGAIEAMKKAKGDTT
jgi:hypothetical protein